MIEAEGELVQIQRQILFANMVIAAHHAALEQRPERFNRVRMDFAYYVLALAVSNDTVGHSTIGDCVIARVLVGRNERDLLRNHLANESHHRWAIRIRDHFADHVPLALNRADDDSFSLTRRIVRIALSEMFVFLLSANKALVHFNDAHQLTELRLAHTRAKAMADVPCGMRGRALAEIHTPDLQRRDALLGLEHRVENLEPRHDGHFRIGEDRSRRNREAERISLAAFLIRALPTEGKFFQRVNRIGFPAARTGYANRPTAIREELAASGFVGEGRHKCLEGHHANNNSAELYIRQVPSYRLRKRPYGSEAGGNIVSMGAVWMRHSENMATTTESGGGRSRTPR
jgi:hypothetical protein